MIKLFTIFILAMGCLLISCNNSAVDLSSSKDTLMLINASPDAGLINISFNNTIVNPSPLAYTQNTNYGLIDAGLKQVITTALANNTQLLSVPILFKNRKVYSVFLAGEIAKGKAIYVATEDSLKNPNKNRAKYRFINLSQNSKILDFRLATNDSVLFANIPFGTATNFNQIKPGKQTFKIISRDTSIKSIDTLSFTLTNGKIYTFWAKGLVKGVGNKALGIQIITNK